MANTHSLDLELSSSQYAKKDYSAGVWEGTGGGNGTETDYTNLTIECWFNPESLPSDGNYMTLFEEISLDAHFYFRILNSSGTYKIEFIGNFTGGTAGWKVVYNDISISTGNWYHIAGVWTGGASGTLKTIFSGDASWGANTTNNDNTSFVDAAGPGAFVGAIDSGAQYFDGLIDDLRIWNTARTEAEIENNRSAELVGNETGLTAYWKFNNDLTDSESGGYSDLTGVNTPTFSATVPFAGGSATNTSNFFQFIN